MAVQVSTGAEVLCTFGAAPAVFNASSLDVAATTPAGVITDVTPENIPTFGMCSAPTNPAVIAAFGSPVPCVPVLSPWTPGAALVTIDDIPALDDTSECMCAWAGVITVSDPGQLSVTIE
ncbi:MAG TPA: DUF4280 domain-containing protein [Trebonia sp.]|nr:DUF4280 domain-containing protein [Trebonia sp.]